MRIFSLRACEFAEISWLYDVINKNMFDILRVQASTVYDTHLIRPK